MPGPFQEPVWRWGGCRMWLVPFDGRCLGRGRCCSTVRARDDLLQFIWNARREALATRERKKQVRVHQSHSAAHRRCNGLASLLDVEVKVIHDFW